MKKLTLILFALIFAVMYFTDAFAMGKVLLNPFGSPLRIYIHVVRFNQAGGRLLSKDALYVGVIHESEDSTLGTIELVEFLKPVDDLDMQNLAENIRKSRARLSYTPGKYTIAVPTKNELSGYLGEITNVGWVELGLGNDVVITLPNDPSNKL